MRKILSVAVAVVFSFAVVGCGSTKAPAAGAPAGTKTETAPAKTETAPAKTETAPAKTETAPAKTETAPKAE